MYPVTRQIDYTQTPRGHSDLFGKPLNSRYDAHFALVHHRFGYDSAGSWHGTVRRAVCVAVRRRPAACYPLGLLLPSIAFHQAIQACCHICQDNLRAAQTVINDGGGDAQPVRHAHFRRRIFVLAQTKQVKKTCVLRSQLPSILLLPGLFTGPAAACRRFREGGHEWTFNTRLGPMT